ncbi:heavy metal translocating P-type ATPase [Microvirga sp. GCM10011540]|uniref:heavy metal translocating P-type ATPase n=1 Tax=Microvirga sp. GCM10011540 TaxID=3317338 RepID=UPI003614124D
MSDRLRFRVEGMDCGSCARKIETALTRVPGISDISINTTTETLRLRAAHADTGEQVEKVVRDLGYGITPVGEGAHHHHDHGAADGPWWQSAKGRLTILSGLGLASAWGLAMVLPGYEPWLYTAAMAIGLVPIARRAIAAAMAGAPFTIETLMAVAAVGAVIIGETEEAAIVVLLFLVGELLEGVAAGRARASIRSLSDLVPKTALIERNGSLEEVAAETLAVGDVIAVRPGDRIPADGMIVSGESAIDEAPVTGESTPKRKGEGETVFAGTINTDGSLRVRVTAEARDNTIARVVRLVEEAQEAKAPTERFIDRFSRYYTPAVLVVGALVAILPPLLAGEPWGEWVYKGLAVLLIGCPCALVISTPAAIAAGLAAGARRGLLIKGGAVLETLGKVTAVALDKTGTLTEGRPQVTDVITLGEATGRDILEDAAALDATSSHPIAKAIVARAQADRIEVVPAVGVMALGGKGVKGRARRRSLFLGSPKAAAAIAPLSPEVEARIASLQEEGKTVSVLMVSDSPAGLIAVRDEPREDALEGLKVLKARGIAPVMLTGDNARTAAAIARALGVESRADLLPQDKLRIVNELKTQGQVVAKVGDGINDAPALAAADVGIAMGGGTDVALETADGAVLHGRVLDIARMIALSKATMGNIRQNIGVALGLKAVFLVTTVLGITGLWPAILADTGATVLVTANAMRLLGAGRNV